MSLNSRSVNQLQNRLVKLQNQIAKIQMERLSQNKSILMDSKDPDFLKGSRIVAEFNRTKKVLLEKKNIPVMKMRRLRYFNR